MKARKKPAGAAVIGIGVDLVEISRMRKALQRQGKAFKKKVFLPHEQTYCESRANPAQNYAARFAVKEAVSKAFGTGVGEHIGWLDIEVLRNEKTGEPSVQLNQKGRALARARGVNRILVSLAHAGDYAIAHAVLVG